MNGTTRFMGNVEKMAARADCHDCFDTMGQYILAASSEHFTKTSHNSGI
jgi:hypothetical protein